MINLRWTAVPLFLVALFAACSLAVDSAGLDDGKCAGDKKPCNNTCVPKNKPDYGCALQTCTPCSLDHALAGCGPAGQCTAVSCNIGYQDCDKSSNNGCEVDVEHDPNNCGQCGNRCTLSNGTPGCSNGACAILSCTKPYASCDGKFASGCGVNLNTDDKNCGKCGNACSTGQACKDGVCTASPS